MAVQTTLLKTVGNDLSPTMKQYYDRALVTNAKANLVHALFGQQRNIPANNGLEVEFRRFSPLPKAVMPLTEGVTPSGNKLHITKITAAVKQYGDYISTSDILTLSSFDNLALEMQTLLGDQAGRTLDAVVREIINAGTNVQYGDGEVAVRANLTRDNIMSVSAIRRAVATLKRNNAKPLKNGHYVAIIHPDVANDLMADPEWVTVKTNCDPKDWYDGVIGRVAGVVFVESSEAKIFNAGAMRPSLSNGDPEYLTIGSISEDRKTIYFAEQVSSLESSHINGFSPKKISVNGFEFIYTTASPGVAGSSSMTLAEPLPTTLNIGPGDKVYRGGGAADGLNVYSTLVIGADAYGVTSIEGGGLETIAKQIGSGGSEDPLNQRATVGWKATQTAAILSPEFMVRIETTCSFGNR